MAADNREQVFGQPTALLAAEAVWLYREEHGSWPHWNRAIDSLEAFPSVDSRREAEERLCQAICNGEVVAKLRERGRGLAFTVEVSDRTANRIARRHIALRATPLRDEEESC